MPIIETIPFHAGDYGQRLEALEDALSIARRDQAAASQGDGGVPQTMLDADPVAALEEQFEALYAEAIEAATVVELSAISRDTWRDLKAKHPPRTVESGASPELVKQDQEQGCDLDGIEDDMVYASVTSPKFTSRDGFNEWAGSLGAGEWQSLVNVAWRITNGARLVPKDRLSSQTRSVG